MPDTPGLRAINVCVFSCLSRFSPSLPATGTWPDSRGPGGIGGRFRSSGRSLRGVTARGRTQWRPARLRGFSPPAGRKGLTEPLPRPRQSPPRFPPEVSLGNPPRYFQHFLNQGPLNRAAQTNWRQKRRSCHDWDQSNISALFALQLRVGLWLRCHRGKSAAARFLYGPGGGGKILGAAAGRWGGVAAGNGEERAGGEGTRAAEAFQPPVPGARSLVKGLHPGQRPACPQ